jgi:hypothetical protein
MIVFDIRRKQPREELIRVLRNVEPRSGETGEELIRVLRIAEPRSGETQEESKGFFEVVLTQPIPK